MERNPGSDTVVKLPSSRNAPFLLLGEQTGKYDGVSILALIQPQKRPAHLHRSQERAHVLCNAGSLVTVSMQALNYQGAVQDGSMPETSTIGRMQNHWLLAAVHPLLAALIYAGLNFEASEAEIRPRQSACKFHVSTVPQSPRQSTGNVASPPWRILLGWLNMGSWGVGTMVMRQGRIRLNRNRFTASRENSRCWRLNGVG
ncbi:hypothetical protein DPV78_011772 [Talaromyces pinophilus]|nr:hypothetical protein DPV78_011772 [Talaromyces pinophilus]